LAAADRITTVGCANFTIVTSQRSTRLTITGYTHLLAITDIVVVTLDVALTYLTKSGGKVAGRVTTTVVNIVATISRLVTAIIGTGHTVITIGRRACLTTGSRITGLGPIAPQAIVTSRRSTRLAITRNTCLFAITGIVVVTLAVVLTDLTLAGG
jgi:hypothetical protein